MAKETNCRKCGAPLTHDAREGVCPKCLLGQALFNDDEPTSESGPSAQIEPLPPVITEGPGTVIGRYKLLEKIGEGGFGTVYMAEQEEPVRRRVALKIIKLGMDTREVIARFEAERQALALMNHPNIAKVFDGGTTDTGRPYFVMELVRGVRITDYCDQKRLSPKQRLELFMQVCQAVQHAHQKGIIHRDLKPSNILVTVNDGVPVPKVIDFGIAKATGQALTDKTLYTRFQQFIGTPAYMSPEQVEMTSVDVDTRTDIYSLGVLLYELLTGKTPFDVQELLAVGLDEMCRTIREKEPPKPSTRLGTLQQAERETTAMRRGMEAPTLVHTVRGDLDWIVMRCLEKDRARRYETANGLAADLTRHLNDEPVVARPPSTVYRASRFVRRNRLGVGAGLVVGVALLAGSSISLRFGYVANDARRMAETQRVEADRLAKQEESQRQRAEAAVTRLEIERVDALLAAGASSRALAYLARLVRHQPTNCVAAERLLSALSHRNFCLPAVSFRHDGPVRAARLSPDGLKVVTALKDNTARLWDSYTGLAIGRPLNHEAEVVWCDFSRDNQRVVTASRDKTVRVWDAQTGEPIKGPLWHKGEVRFAGFGPDGRHVLSVAQDGTVHLWDLESGASVLVITNQTGIEWACLSPEGQYLLAGGRGRALVFDPKDAMRVASFPFKRNWQLPVQIPEFSPDGALVAAPSTLEVTIRDTRMKGFPALARLEHRNNPSSVAFSPDGTLIATASLDTTAQVWDPRTGQAVGPRLQHDDEVLSLQFDRSGTRLITSSKDKMLRVWDVATGRPLTEPIYHEHPIFSVQFSSDNQRFLAIGEPGRVWLWNVRFAPRLLPTLRHAAEIRHAVFSKDGQVVATGGWDGRARTWSALSGRLVAETPWHNAKIHVVRISPDGRHFATVTDTRDAAIWDARTGRLVARQPARCRTAHFCNLQYSPDGRRLVLPTGDLTWILNAENCEIICQLRHKNVQYAEFNGDGSRVVTASLDGTARVWDAFTGQPLTMPMRHDEEVWWAEFSRDGTRVVTASSDKTARIWNALTGEMVTKPLLHADRLGEKHSVQFSPDGLWVATAAGDAAQVWDACTGEPIIPPIRLRGRVSSVRFSPDGKRLITACIGGDPRIWDAATGLPASEPLGGGAGSDYAEFSPDGELALTVSLDGTARIWLAPRVATTVASWLPELAEALAGRRIDDQDISTPVPVEDLFRLARQLGGNTNQDNHGIWLRWFFDSGTNPPPISHFLFRELEQASNGLQMARAAVDVLNGAKGDPKEMKAADTLSRRAVELASTNSAVLTIRVEVLKRSGHSAEALALLENAVERMPANPVLWTNYGNLLAETARQDEALQCFSKAVELAKADTNLFGPVLKGARLSRAGILRQMNRLAEAARETLAALDIPERDSQAGPEMLDLSPFFNCQLLELLGSNAAVALEGSALSQTGVRFDLRGVVLVAGTNKSVLVTHPLPTAYTNILVNRRLTRLQVLQGTMYQVNTGTQIGGYTLHYADGRTHKFPILYGRDVRNWWWPADEQVVSGAHFVRTGEKTAMGYTGPVRLYQVTLENPFPEVEVTHLDFVSAMTKCSPFLIAITVEP